MGQTKHTVGDLSFVMDKALNQLNRTNEKTTKKKKEKVSDSFEEQLSGKLTDANLAILDFYNDDLSKKRDEDELNDKLTLIYNDIVVAVGPGNECIIYFARLGELFFIAGKEGIQFFLIDRITKYQQPLIFPLKYV